MVLPAEREPATRILIAGIGNIFLGDDAFGVDVARRLSALRLPDGVRVAEFGIRGMDLAYALSGGCDTAILVDASPRGEPAGTVSVLEVAPEHLGDANAGPETHGMDPVRVLRLVRALGAPLPRVFVVTCEPLVADLDEDGAMGLSPPVAAAVDVAVDAVLSLVDRLRAGTRAATLASVTRGA